MKPQNPSTASASSPAAYVNDEDDFLLVRRIRQRFSHRSKVLQCGCEEKDNPLTLKSLNILLLSMEDDDDDDDKANFAILRRMLPCYDQDGQENSKEKQEQVSSKGTYLKKGASCSVELDKTNAPFDVPDTFDMHNVLSTSVKLDAATPDTSPSCLMGANETETHDLVMFQLRVVASQEPHKCLSRLLGRSGHAKSSYETK